MILLFICKFESGLSAFRYTYFNTIEINIQEIFMFKIMYLRKPRGKGEMSAFRC